MKLSVGIVLILLTFCVPAAGQKNSPKVFTSDIDNFWQAYDSCQTTKDCLSQLHFIQTLYVDNGTKGLKAFMEARDYTPGLWVKLLLNKI